MQIGVIFPQTELGGDRGSVRAYGQAASDLGFTHLAAYDHVLGADPSVHGDLGGPYDLHHTFHEPLTLFSYLAGFTGLGFATSILIGPQRQTALLAKQVAEVDLLCGGRFRLGLGIGWNRVEYEALGHSFATRGAFLEEQITVLRQLWTQESVTFEGSFHHIPRRAWRPCRRSGPSRSGSVRTLRPPCVGWAGWPTAGSPWCVRAAAWRRHGRPSPRRPVTRAGIRRPSSSRAALSTPPGTPSALPRTPSAGAQSGPPTSRSTR